jgi:alkylation response protein AidB-like acyl-CoA dehydrogenase
VRDGDEWVIDGHKWFSSGADGAAFAIVLAITDPDASRTARDDDLVPADTPGVEIVRADPVMGHAGRGWTRTARCATRASASRSRTRSGERRRLPDRAEAARPGRIHHVMRWLGQMQRAFELMCRTRSSARRSAAARGQADRAELDRRLGGRDPGLPAADDGRRAQDRRGSEARVEVSLLKFYARGCSTT